MKINWFSPLPPAPTDIAHYTTRTLPALAQHAQVTLWTDQTEWDKSLTQWAKVKTWRGAEPDWTELNRADVSFYHIGNNPLFHGDIWRISRRNAGLVVLHDLRLHHFFDGLYREQANDRAGYLAVMERFYGPTARADAVRCYDTNASNINDMAQRYPFTALATENALGVIVHTRPAFESLQHDARQPVIYAPLPFAASPLSSESSRADGPPYRLIIFGYLGRNRRLKEILQALAALPERAQFQLDIYGEIADRAAIEAEIRFTGLVQQTQVHGFVPEPELDAALARAHLAFNLRYPTMGEASGSQLRIWAHALPSLVTEIGWYATLNAQAVAFVRPDHETADIIAHLQAFLIDPQRFAAMGQRGREILETEHAPAMYAASLLECARQASCWRAQNYAYKMTARLAPKIAAWDAPACHNLLMQQPLHEIGAIAGWWPPAKNQALDQKMPLTRPPTQPETWRTRLQNLADKWLLHQK